MSFMLWEESEYQKRVFELTGRIQHAKVAVQ